MFQVKGNFKWFLIQRLFCFIKLNDENFDTNITLISLFLYLFFLISTSDVVVYQFTFFVLSKTFPGHWKGVFFFLKLLQRKLRNVFTLVTLYLLYPNLLVSLDFTALAYSSSPEFVHHDVFGFTLLFLLNFNSSVYSLWNTIPKWAWYLN